MPYQNILSTITKKLSVRSLYVLFGVVLLMSLVYLVPLWYIGMTGRQFTEPLSLSIWVSKITGGTDVDIYTINDFNHYIGMKKIYPDAIPELRYMPFIIGYMILGAILTLFIRRLYMIVLGIINMCLVVTAGLYDFSLWLHNYGTELDTSAPLYDVAVDFQPPLFACKDILNVTTCSWPLWGSWFLFLSGCCLVYIIWYEYKLGKSSAFD